MGLHWEDECLAATIVRRHGEGTDVEGRGGNLITIVEL